MPRLLKAVATELTNYKSSRLETAIGGFITKLGRTEMGNEGKREYMNCNCVIVVKSAT